MSRPAVSKIKLFCAHCNKEFYAFPCEIRKNKKFCSRDCYLKSVEGKIEKTCEVCGKQFYIFKSESKRKHQRGRFCSSTCYGKWVSTSRIRTTRVTLKCKQCGVDYEVNKYKEHTSNFCSYDCRSKWRSENLRGENHWQYKPKIEMKCKHCGKPFFVNEYRFNNEGPKYCSKACSYVGRRTGSSYGKYCEKFNSEFKERVKEFFDNTCMLCGKVFPSGKSGLCVHHVHYIKSSCCNEDVPKLFVPLCNSCHCKTTMCDREYWTRYFEDIIYGQFDGKCYYTKEEYAQILSNSTED